MKPNEILENNTNQQEWIEAVKSKWIVLASIISMFAPHELNSFLKAKQTNNSNDLYISMSEAWAKIPSDTPLKDQFTGYNDLAELCTSYGGWRC